MKLSSSKPRKIFLFSTVSRSLSRSAQRMRFFHKQISKKIERLWFAIHRKVTASTCDPFTKRILENQCNCNQYHKNDSYKNSRMKMNCGVFCDKFVFHSIIFLFIFIYWIYEAVMLIVWISLGVGTAYGITSVFQGLTSSKLSNAWESYLTVYILACGVFFQTNFHIMFWGQVLVNIKAKAATSYKAFRMWPIRILVCLSIWGLFVQFNARYENNKLSFEEENTITFRFLLGVCFLAYTLGRKIRQDYKMDESYFGRPFACPGIIKYCIIFSVFYVMEIVLLFVWGFPVILMAFSFQYYYFPEVIIYYSLICLGILCGYIVAGMERGYGFNKGPFVNEPMTPRIYAEVRTNVILFSIVPFMTRWYFKIQFVNPEYKESNKMNFILFSVNASFLLMYFVKQVMHYKYKRREEGLYRHRRVDNVRVVHPGEDELNHNDPVPQLEQVSSISTGSFSGSGNSSSMPGKKLSKASYAVFSWTAITNISSDTDNKPQKNLENKEGERKDLNETKDSNDERGTQTISPRKSEQISQTMVSENNNNNDLFNQNNHHEGQLPEPHAHGPIRMECSKSLKLRPLSSSFGIMKIDKRYRDAMMNPSGSIKRLSYSKHSSRIPIPISRRYRMGRTSSSHLQNRPSIRTIHPTNYSLPTRIVHESFHPTDKRVSSISSSTSLEEVV